MKPLSPQNAPNDPPTTRDIAKRLGVSSATVSMALRNQPGVSAHTCKIVQKTAKEMGYFPDPDVAKLMLHLRRRQKPRFQSLLCALTTLPEDHDAPYLRNILESAQRQAESLGYGFMVVRLEDAEEMARRKDLQRILESRGVKGILLAPMRRPRSFEAFLDWSRFSVVAATNGILGPVFHRVVPHQFNNMLMICDEIVKQGYRRIGIALSRSHDLTTHHAFSAAVAWQNIVGGTEFVRPFVYPEGDVTESLQQWFAEEKPDAIIDSDDSSTWLYARILGLTIPGAIGFASAHLQKRSTIAGMDERPREIGAVAIKQLTNLIQHGENGPPPIPTVTMIEGQWLPGASIRKRRSSRT